MPMCIITRYLLLETTRRQSSQYYYEKYINIKKITMGKKPKLTQVVGTGTGQSSTGYRYGNSNTTNKPSLKFNIIKIKDTVFNQGRISNAATYEDSIDNLINYVQRE